MLRAILSTGAAPAARGCSAPPSTPDATALVIGKHGVGKANSNGITLLDLCSELDLVITNTHVSAKRSTEDHLAAPKKQKGASPNARPLKYAIGHV